MIETRRDGLKRELAVTVPAAYFEERIGARIAEVRPNLKMSGFRKGHVPDAVIRKHVLEEVLDGAVREAIKSIEAHLSSGDETPVARPTVEANGGKWNEGEDYGLTCKYEVFPEIPEIDLTAISVERLSAPVERAEIDKALAMMLQDARGFEPREPGAQAAIGDLVTIDVEAFRDGVAVAEEAIEGFQLVLGRERSIPGLDEKLAGARVGEARTLQEAPPESRSLSNPEAAGKSVEYSCVVREIEAPSGAGSDEEVARKIGAPSLAALRLDVEKKLGEVNSTLSRRLMHMALDDRLLELADFQVPETLVKSNAVSIARNRLGETAPGESGDDGNVEPSEADFEAARRMTKLSLIYDSVSAKAGLGLNENEAREAVGPWASAIPEEEHKRFFEALRTNQELRARIFGPRIQEKTFDYMAELASVTVKKCDSETLRKALAETPPDDDAEAARAAA